MIAQARPSLRISPRMAWVLLRWFDRYGRALPWRYRWRTQRRQRPNPYHIWLSEIMLQQTMVAAVRPYFEKFIRLWPDLPSLAAAPLDEILRAWAGLGYYQRARSLHKCARAVMRDHNGRFPEDEKSLLGLAGIGTYTAAAIAAQAFDKRAIVVDGNVKRVMARIFAIKNLDEKAIYAHAEKITPKSRAGDYAQAVMDLGAMICTPRRPDCLSCPWQRYCQAHQMGQTDMFGRRAAKAKKPHRKGRAFILLRKSDRAIFLRRRPSSGLLGAMMEFPSCGWDGKETKAPMKALWKKITPPVDHVFTHFSLELSIYYALLDQKEAGSLASDQNNQWVKKNKISAQALPSLMQKVWKRAYADDAFAKALSQARQS